MKRLFAFILSSLFVMTGFLLATVSVSAQSSDVVAIHVLGRPDCQHCRDLEEFLTELETERSDFTVINYNIRDNESDAALWERVTSEKELSKVTPIILVGKTLITGFDTAETTGKRLQELLDVYEPSDSVDFETYLTLDDVEMEVNEDGTCTEEECFIQYEPFYVNIPFFGVVDVKQYSLPVMSMILGFIDGFNPCAMWVLVSFLIILSQVGDRRKMWTFAGLFIVAEAIMYTLILTVWFSTWDFVGLDKYVSPLVGLLALGSGCFFLYEWKYSDPGECKVTNLDQRKKIMDRIKDLTSQKFTLLTGLGIMGLAFSVNVIEFACSIGIPQAFTKILELNGLSLVESSYYIFLYILFYMFDDFIVFGIALYSFEKIGLTSKYSKLSNLIGGILMLGLGLILLFKPELLHFV